jgi:hypothetical protein
MPQRKLQKETGDKPGGCSGLKRIGNFEFDERAKRVRPARNPSSLGLTGRPSPPDFEI